MEEAIEPIAPRKRGRPRKDGAAVPVVLDPDKKRAKQNMWMHQYLTPGHFQLIVSDAGDGTKRGKCVFLVPEVKTNMNGKRGKVPAICIVDVLVNQEGDVVRKPNYRAMSAGTSKKGTGPDRKTYMYEQLFVTLDLVSDVAHAMLSIGGCEGASAAEAKSRVVAAVHQKTEDEKWMDENISKALGGLL